MASTIKTNNITGFSGGAGSAPITLSGDTATLSGTGVIFTRPAFLVQASAMSNLSVGSDLTLDYDTVIKNLGGGTFASNTYTAPVSGLYQINATTYFSGYPNNITSVQMKIVTSNRTIRKHYGRYLNAEHPTNYTQSLNISSVVDLDANDTCKIQYLQTGGSAAADLNVADSYFSGFLVSNY